jgi:hypothetical protein
MFFLGTKFHQNMKNRNKNRTFYQNIIFSWKNHQIKFEYLFFGIFFCHIWTLVLFCVALFELVFFFKLCRRVLKTCPHFMLNAFWDASQWRNMRKLKKKSMMPKVNFLKYIYDLFNKCQSNLNTKYLLT